MAPTEQDLLAALRTVRYPGFTRDIVSFGLVKEIEVREGAVRVRLDLGGGNPAVGPALEREIRAALEARAGARSVEVEIVSSGAGSARAAGPENLLPEVRHTIAVASGKGGVGKSTVAVNLAVALARRGARTGLLDADIYGPSIPIMMGVDESPSLDPERRLILPFERCGVRFMSIGFLVDRRTAVIWRGPMVMKAIEQLLRDVDWGPLDVLVLDMPPGTGDAQLTVSQKLRLAGAIIVTTPQDVALQDAIKGVNMFRKVGVPVLGIVENMSFFQCPRCGARTEVFGYGGGREEAVRLDVPFLGEIALDPAIRESGDAGQPLVVRQPGSAPALAFDAIASRVLDALARAPAPPAARSSG
jgi:ATP-binding protein involved in chromosome partitioning